jgi:hypothetical protein
MPESQSPALSVTEALRASIEVRKRNGCVLCLRAGRGELRCAGRWSLGDASGRAGAVAAFVAAMEGID